uniref:Thrombomodulin-like n=1 Tax=Sinocyclocheilus anshuiensis TaxID=1608454 RepID=A0A671K6T8_9TELE
MRDIIGLALALVVLRVRGENINDGYCVDGKCFVFHVDSASFDAAQLVCQEKGGHLMTVRTENAADVLGGLLNGASGDFWLGLKYAGDQCSDSNDGLKGYRWVTGDNKTQYVNWKSDLRGYLCEYDNPGYCPPLSVDAPWLKAPWSCEVFGGGCDYKCIQKGQSYACICQPGFELDTNGVACNKQDDDPCAECEHKCTRSGDALACTCRPGFQLSADGKSCEECKPDFHTEGGVCVDDDECESAPCEHYCINTDGSYHCECFEGFIQSMEDMHKCKMHCEKNICPAECDPNNNAQEDFEGSGSSTPFDIFIPTSRSPTDKPVSISAGSLFGIMVCMVVCILLLVCLAHCIMRRHSKMHHYDVDKGHDEIFDFQQVIIEKHSLQTFPSRYIKRDT